MKYFNQSLVFKNIKQGLILACCCFFIINTASANQTETIPFVKGSFSQIQKQRKDTPYIITFWSETCAYCMKELALLGELIKTYNNVEIVSITTDPFLEDETVNRILSSKNLQHIDKWVFADNYAERLYYDVDKNWRGELPLTYFFDRKNNKVKHMGVIKKAELVEWFAEQNPHKISID